MGLAEGGLTFRTYFVDGEVPRDFRQDYLDRIRTRRFEPLEIESEEDVRAGWVPIGDPLATELHTPDVYLNQYVVLGMRIDRWAIPPVLLKARVSRAERAIKKEQGRDHLSRTERGAIVELERARLKRQTLPAARVVDMGWNLNTGEVRFCGLSRLVNELFTDLFELTFGLRLFPDNPYTRAMTCGLSDALVGELAAVEPARWWVGEGVEGEW